MGEYPDIAEATQNIRTKVSSSDQIIHPFCSPALSVVVPAWTVALTGFEARTTISPREAGNIEQIRALYETNRDWLVRTASDLEIRTLNEHDPSNVLFMGLFRDLQIRFAPKQNLNPHKFAVLLGERYEIDE